MNKNLINTLQSVVDECNSTIASELEKYEMTTSTPGDISSRYWLSNFLEPLNKKELKSICDSFLIQMLNEDQAKKIIKFLLIRFPDYYSHLSGEPQPEPQPEKIDVPIELSNELTEIESPIKEEVKEEVKEEIPKEVENTEEVKDSTTSSIKNFEPVFRKCEKTNSIVGMVKLIKTGDEVTIGVYSSIDEAMLSVEKRISSLEKLISGAV